MSSSAGGPDQPLQQAPKMFLVLKRHQQKVKPAARFDLSFVKAAK
jgi:hypothetical protein